MKQRIVLAYSGSLASSAAVAWLLERHGSDVVTLTVDVGQTDDLEEVRGRALACGAIRAHVVDARDTFARDCVVPALRAGVPPSLAHLAEPLIAATLAQIAAIENAGAVAHAGADPAAGGAGLEAWLAGSAPSLRVVAPAREWAMDAAGLADYARARTLPGSVTRPEPHLLIRRAVDPARAPRVDAHLDIAFVNGIPAALNGVQMTLQELIESLSLIAGQYGLGYGEPIPAPAAIVLRAAYAAASGGDETVRVTLQPGTYTVERGWEAAGGQPRALAAPAGSVL